MLAREKPSEADGEHRDNLGAGGPRGLITLFVRHQHVELAPA